jgi:hypothetical protein
MRQQLITWLIDDIAPEIRRTKDAEGTLLKFANEQNMAPAQLEALGQMLNTARTLAHFDKAGIESRGDSFPILDVESIVDKYMSVKRASVATGKIDTWEFDCEDGSENDLPAIFREGLTPVLREEKPVLSKAAEFRQAAVEAEDLRVDLMTTQQILADTHYEIEKQAGDIAHTLRLNRDYSFRQMEADALTAFADRPSIKDTLDKVAKFCQGHTHPVNVERAACPSNARLIEGIGEQLMWKLEHIDDAMFKVAACHEFMKEAAGSPAALELRQALGLEDPTAQENFETPLGEQPSIDPASGRSQASGGRQSKPAPPGPPGPSGPKKNPSSVYSGTADADSGKERQDAGLFGKMNDKLDSALGYGAKRMEPTLTDLLFKVRNRDQELIDNRMREARQMALLQNLMTTDEVLSVADPDRVLANYQTVREAMPDHSTDVNVMRVVLRSMMQHDGISPYDLKGLLDTEAAKQKVDWNKRVVGEVDYNRAKAQVPPMKVT